MTISWPANCTELLRHLIDDLDSSNYLYSDARLQRLLIVAAFQVLTEADFAQSFVVNIGAQTITPDPTDVDGGTNDDDFVNLICLKAACILSNGVAIQAANGAVSGRDMNSSWDLKAVAQYSIDLLEKGWCKMYNQALDDYLSGDGAIGAAVMGPFRTKVRGYPGNYLY